MKRFTALKPTLALALFFAAPLAARASESPPSPAELAGRYNLHLYFGDSTPFLDELVLRQLPVFTPDDLLDGHMFVPNDFDARIQVVEQSARRLVFDVLVPRNAARPRDLLFRYETQFLTEDPMKGAGFVHIVAEGDAQGQLRPTTPSYVASFLLFRKPAESRP